MKNDDWFARDRGLSSGCGPESSDLRSPQGVTADVGAADLRDLAGIYVSYRTALTSLAYRYLANPHEVDDVVLSHHFSLCFSTGMDLVDRHADWCFIFVIN